MYAPRSRSYCTAFNKAAAGHTLLISVKFKALKCDIRKKAEKPCAHNIQGIHNISLC